MPKQKDPAARAAGLSSSKHETAKNGSPLDDSHRAAGEQRRSRKFTIKVVRPFSLGA